MQCNSILNNKGYIAFGNGKQTFATHEHIASLLKRKSFLSITPYLSVINDTGMERLFLGHKALKLKCSLVSVPPC